MAKKQEFLDEVKNRAYIKLLREEWNRDKCQRVISWAKRIREEQIPDDAKTAAEEFINAQSLKKPIIYPKWAKIPEKSPK